MFQIACSTFDTDIITFDPENKNVIKLSRKLYNQAINRGLVFELMYTPAIRDSTHRKNIIHMSHLYHAFGKSKQIIVSSWASEPQHVRSPYDIVNLYPFRKIKSNKLIIKYLMVNQLMPVTTFAKYAFKCYEELNFSLLFTLFSLFDHPLQILQSFKEVNMPLCFRI